MSRCAEWSTSEVSLAADATPWPSERSQQLARPAKAIAAAMLKMGWSADRPRCRVKGYGANAGDDKVVVRKLSGYRRGVLPEGVLDTFLMFDPSTGRLVPTVHA